MKTNCKVKEHIFGHKKENILECGIEIGCTVKVHLKEKMVKPIEVCLQTTENTDSEFTRNLMDENILVCGVRECRMD